MVTIVLLNSFVLGPGYKTPLDAFHSGDREKLLYVICINPEPKKRPTPDYLAVIDVDPASSTYSQVSNDFQLGIYQIITFRYR